MNKMEFSRKKSCLWTLRFEVLGVILLAIATGLTIASGHGLGIVALFAAGVILCLFNQFCNYVSSSRGHASCPICSYHSEEAMQTPENEAKQTMDNEGGNQINRTR